MVGDRDGGRGKNSRCLLELAFRTCALNTKIIFILAITQRECPLAGLQLLLGKHRKEHNSTVTFVPMVPVFTEMQLSRKLKFFRRSSEKARKAIVCLLVIPVDVYQTSFFLRENPLIKFILFFLLCFAKDCCRQCFLN